MTPSIETPGFPLLGVSPYPDVRSGCAVPWRVLVPGMSGGAMSDGQSFEAELSAVVEAQVMHVAPCVPECPVCYPPEGESE